MREHGARSSRASSVRISASGANVRPNVLGGGGTRGRHGNHSKPWQFGYRTQPGAPAADKLACCFSLLLSFSGLPDAPPATPLSMRTWLSARVARFLWSHWAGNPGRVSLAPRLPTRHRLPTRFLLRRLRDLRLAHHPRSLRSRFRARPRQPCRDGVPRVAQREPAGSPRALNKSVPAAACPFPTLMLAAKRAVAVTAAGPGRCPSRGYGPCWPTAAPRPRRFFT